MKKKLLVLLIVVGLVIAGGALAASAQGGDTVNSNTSWTFQNLGSATANVSVDLNDVNGNTIATDSFDVTTSSSFYAPTYPPLNSVTSFNGAIVASSTEPLASIANQVAANTTSGRTANATYMGFTEKQVAPTMYAPVVMKNFAGYYTEASVQSTASSGDITVDVKYFDQAGAQVGSTSSYTVAAGSPTRIAQNDEAGLPDGFNGSMTVSAQDGTTDIALVINELVGTTGGMYNQFYSYEGFSGGAKSVTLPAVFINGYGSFNASTSVQNLDGPANPATVTWHFYDTTPGNPSPATEIYSFTEVITTSKSVYFPSESYASTLTGAYTGAGSAADQWVGSVTLESNQNMVAIVNELSGSYLAASYTGFSSGVTELNYPLAFVGAYGFANTSFSIADTSGTSGLVNVTVDYVADTTQCAGCSDTSFTYDFTNTDSQYQPTQLAGSSALDTNGVFIGAIKITVNTSGKTINGIMNELLGGDVADNFTSFNSFSTQ